MVRVYVNLFCLDFFYLLHIYIVHSRFNVTYTSMYAVPKILQVMLTRVRGTQLESITVFYE